MLAAAGTGVAAYLAWVALVDEQEASCSGVGDCQAVQRSEFAEIAGVPIALLGLGMYATLLALCAPDLRVAAGPGPRSTV